MTKILKWISIIALIGVIGFAILNYQNSKIFQAEKQKKLVVRPNALETEPEETEETDQEDVEDEENVEVIGVFNYHSKNEQGQALQEVANAYLMRQDSIQYNSPKISVYGAYPYFSPEEATSNHKRYITCSTFVANVYRELFGVKLLTESTRFINYSNKYTKKCMHSYY